MFIFLKILDIIYLNKKLELLVVLGNESIKSLKIMVSYCSYVQLWFSISAPLYIMYIALIRKQGFEFFWAFEMFFFADQFNPRPLLKRGSY